MPRESHVVADPSGPCSDSVTAASFDSDETVPLVHEFDDINNVNNGNIDDDLHDVNIDVEGFCRDGTILEEIPDDIKDHILGFLSASDILQLTMVRKRYHKLVSMDAAMLVVLNTSKWAIHSIYNLHRLMKKRAIYPITIRRLLRIGLGKVCEFCFNNKVHVLRPQSGTFVCWKCMNTELYSERQVENDEASSTELNEIISVNVRWHKAYLKANGKTHIKQYYAAHRGVLYNILSHRRVLAYPYGMRKVKQSSGRIINSKDSYEILWRKPWVDFEGDAFGPLITYQHLSSLVSFIESNINNTVDRFIEKYVEDAPLLWEYDPFISSFNKYFPRIFLQYQNQKELDANARFNNRCIKIDRFSKALHCISVCCTITDLDLRDEIANFPPATLDDVMALRRLLLCYISEYNTQLRWCATYDTGNSNLNYTVDSILRPVMQSPSKVIIDSSAARSIARKLFLLTRGFFSFNRLDDYEVPALFNNGTLRSDFRFQFKSHTHKPPKVKRWVDPSPNRRL